MKPRLSYSVESVPSCREEMEEITRPHWKESSCLNEWMEFDMNWEMYEKLTELGIAKLITMRYEGKLVGYLHIIISPAMHSQHTKTSTCDGLYILPEHRGRDNSKELIDLAEKTARDMGAKIFNLPMPAKSTSKNFLGSLDYRLMEYNFSKRL